jgi:phage/plasmid-associated DNA primase
MNQNFLVEAGAATNIDKDVLKDKTYKMSKIYEKLNNNTFLHNVVQACARKFMGISIKFEEKLDSNPNLIGFENGVYDLKNKIFRKGQPEDYIKMSVGYNYIKYKMEDPIIKKINDYFVTIQTETDMREYILRLMSSFLDGHVRDQQFVMWTGSGCHAKDEEIKMFNGTTKKIQNIDLKDRVLGADGRHRTVVAVYNGKSQMYTVKASNNIKFVVNGKHRIALRSHYKTNIKELCGKYIVMYNEYIENIPIIFEKQYDTMNEAINYIKKLAKNNRVINYGDIIPVDINSWLCMLKNDELYKTNITSYYKLVNYEKDMEYDCSFDCTLNSDEKEDFYGIELDGDKKYVMNNGFITYNSNGKSCTIDLLKNSLGEYAGTLRSEILTRRKGGAGSANPDLADKKGKRLLTIQEPEKDDIIYVGQMKELVAGNDTISARALYGDPFEYKPQFKIALICNDLPELSGIDDGVKRRIKAVPFNSIFILDGRKPVKKNEFTANKELATEILNWKQPFIWILINIYYPKYIKEGLNEPKAVTACTDKYKINSDFYYEFITLNIIFTQNENDVENFDCIYGLFKEWFRMNFTKKMPSKKEFVTYFSSKEIYKVDKNILKGVKLIEL